MKLRIGRRNYRIYGMDIESHNDDESKKLHKTSCWLGAFLDETSKEEDESSYFYSINEFLDIIERESSLKRSKSKNQTRPCNNLCIYIYNLSFEWSFILPVILKRGFTFKEKIEKSDEYVFNSITTKSVSSVWQVQLKFGSRSGFILIRDLNKIFSGSLRNLAKSFGLETQKGDIDYTLNRLHGHVVTKEEKHYVFNDVRILIEILMKMQERGDKEFWKSSSAASYSMLKLLKTGYPRKTKPYKAFREEYPELDEEETKFLRKAVSGGITYAPSKFQFKDIKQKIGHIDKHQMHPSSAYFNRFPYGKGEYFTGIPSFTARKIRCCHIKVSFDNVKLHSIIQLIGLEAVTDYELTVWDFEIPTMYKCYENLVIEYIDGYSYNIKPLTWREYYANNYKQRLIAKKAGDKFGILYYKLLNNSSYGKLLERPHNEIFKNTIQPHIWDDGSIINTIDSVILDKAPEEIAINAKYTYLPVGACIPAYSRVDLIETALKFGWEKIVYFDTDSIFFLMDEETDKVWKSLNQVDFLGGWGWEETIDRAQFTAPKRYKTETNGVATIKAGGINFTAYAKEKEKELNLEEGTYKLGYEEVNITSSKWQVQRAYRVEGGTIIDFQEKEIKIPEKYLGIYEQNKSDM